jgi:hypothetical protein
MEEISKKFKEFGNDLFEGLENTVKVMAVLGITNLSSFSTVAMEKYISGYSNEKAAFINSLSAVPILYDIGFDLGHQLFYGDRNFMKTAEEQTGIRNLFPREYLGR